MIYTVHPHNHSYSYSSYPYPDLFFTIIQPDRLFATKDINKYLEMGCISLSGRLLLLSCSRSVRSCLTCPYIEKQSRGRKMVEDGVLGEAFYYWDQLEEFTGQAAWQIDATQCSRASSGQTIPLWANYRSMAESKC